MNTVEMEKLAIRKLKINSKRVMTAAERLYQKGKTLSTSRIIIIKKFLQATSHIPGKCQYNYRSLQ